MRTTGSLHYFRHFVLLTGASVLILGTREWRASFNLSETFAVYGGLHALTLVSSLRRTHAWGRRVLFVAVGAGLSMSSVAVASFAGRHGVARLGEAWPVSLLVVASGAGAASYALSIKMFWIRNLPVYAPGSVAVCCAMLTLGLWLGRSGLPTMSASFLAVAWWCTFSTSLCYHDAWARDIKGRHVRDS